MCEVHDSYAIPLFVIGALSDFLAHLAQRRVNDSYLLSLGLESVLVTFFSSQLSHRLLHLTR